MMEGKILFLNRKDLLKKSEFKKIEDIGYDDFSYSELEGTDKWGYSFKKVSEADFILFFDDNGREKILKNRSGKDCIIF